MADVWDLISTLTGGQTPATVLGPAAALGPVAPLAGPAVLGAQNQLAQWANVPGPPQNVGDVFNRLGQLLHAANTLGGGAGMIASQPYLHRQAQIANDPRLANIPLPWIAGMAGTSLAIPSLLPGGQQIAEGLGLPAPPQGYGDVIAPPYAASAQQEGGLAGLGAALDVLKERWDATPETIPMSKFVLENVTNPINYLGTIAKAPGLVGQAGQAGVEAMNLPFRAVKGGLGHIPYFSEQSDFSKRVNMSRFREDLARQTEATLGNLGLELPEAFGFRPEDARRVQGLHAVAGATAPPAEDAALLQQAAAQATDHAAAAKATIEPILAAVTPERPPAGAEPPIFQVGGQIGVPPAAAPVADAAGAAAVAGGPLHPLKWYNDRAQGSYRFAQEAATAALPNPPQPAHDIPLDIVRGALDPQGQADDWLGAVLTTISKEGVSPGRAQEQTAKAARREGFLRGMGGLPGFTSARTGELIYEPETVHQVADVVLRLQDRTRRGQAGGLPLGEHVRLATGIRWMEEHQYGDTFPAPPPGDQTYWAAIQRHMETLGDLPRPAEPTAPPPGGLPGPAPAAGGATTMLPEEQAFLDDMAARRTSGEPILPANQELEQAILRRQGQGAPPSAVWDETTGRFLAPEPTAPPAAGAALPLEGVPPTAAPPAGAPPVPGALSSAEDAALLAREEYLGQVLRHMEQRFPTASGVPDAARDAIRAELTAIHTQRLGGPTRTPITPPEQFAPPSLVPEGPLGGLADVPPTPFEAGTTMRQDPAVAQRLVDAQKAERIVRAESEDPQEIMAAIAETKAAQAAADADLAAGFPDRAQVLAGEFAPQIAATQEMFGEFVKPGEMGAVTKYGAQLRPALDKLAGHLSQAHALRTEAGLPTTASLPDTIKALKAQGSDRVGEAQALQDYWKGDILTGNLPHIVNENTVATEIKDLGLNPDQFGGPAWVRSITEAWRAQALLSGSFHLKNTLDSVIKSYIDAGKPGFTEGARPWNPAELRTLFTDAWRDSGAANPNAALSPQVRVFSAIKELPLYDTQFAAANPTLAQALKALPEESYKNVVAQLSPVERAFLKVDPALAVPSAIQEATGPLEAGGFLGKIPVVDRVLALNLKFTMGIEQSARGAKFMDAYNDAIQQGLPKHEAWQQGISEANRLFFDYQGDMSNADRLFRNALGFHTFATRNLNYYAPVLASNPIMLKALKGWEDYSTEMAEEGGYTANRRFAESIKIPMVSGMGGLLAQALFGRTGQIFWNPAVYWSIAEQGLTTPQEYRDEPPIGKALSKARNFGLGLAPWVDLPLQALGTYGTRGPQSITSLDTLIESGAQQVLGRPTELPWKTVQRIRPPGQNVPAGLDVAVRQRLREMSLEERPDFAQISPRQPVHPDFVRAMAEGPDNPLYQEAARDLGKERFLGTLTGKFIGGGPAFQSETSGRIAAAQGNMPRDLTRGQREQYLAGREALLAPEDRPLLTSAREASLKGLNEPGSRAAGAPEESVQAYVARVWPTASPARQWALLQTQDPALKEALMTYIGGRMRLH